jgi:hypothetical protein
VVELAVRGAAATLFVGEALQPTAKKSAPTANKLNIAFMIQTNSASHQARCQTAVVIMFARCVTRPIPSAEVLINDALALPQFGGPLAQAAVNAGSNRLNREPLPDSLCT